MTPRPAATIILLRRGGRHGGRAIEVLLVRRNPGARFMPNAWVFPGGVVDTEGDGEQAEPARADAAERAHRACAARELHEEAGIALPPDAELLPWSRWITPELAPLRFDTRFYVTLAPPHAPPRPDGQEVVEAAWLAPRRALELHRAGQLVLVYPTIKHLEELATFTTAEAVLAAAPGRRIVPVCPRVIGEGAERRVLLPGDPGHQR